MRLVVDADALIKLIKAGAKEIVSEAVELWIPPKVHREVIVEGKRGGHPDAIEAEANVMRRKVRLIAHRRRLVSSEARLLFGGEREVLSAFRGGGFDAVVSDDQRFLMRLDGFAVPFFTPGALLVVLARRGRLERERVAMVLERLRAWISADEYALCRMAIEEVSRDESQSTETP